MENCGKNVNNEVSKVYKLSTVLYLYPSFFSQCGAGTILASTPMWATWFSQVPWTCPVKSQKFTFKQLIYLAEK